MLNCPNRRCLLTAMPELRWKPTRNGALHLGAYCPGCGTWIKWVPMNAEWLQRAPALPPILSGTVPDKQQPQTAAAVQPTLF